jgi:hypothetical protein
LTSKTFADEMPDFGTLANLAAAGQAEKVEAPGAIHFARGLIRARALECDAMRCDTTHAMLGAAPRRRREGP